MISENSLSTHTIFRPSDLSAFGDTNKLPVIAWGNGACANTPDEHKNFLSEVASHGFLIVAIGKPTPNDGERPRQCTTSSQLIDATVADQYIRYLTDLSLVNEVRVKTERIIDEFWKLVKDQLLVKTRTYRKKAQKRYLSQSKKKKASRASLLKALLYLLNCVERNLGHIDDMLTMLDDRAFPLAHKYQRQLWVIHTLYAQQRGMYDADSHRCDDRIVSISQPPDRPIVRGKTGKRVEFGAKLGLSLLLAATLPTRHSAGMPKMRPLTWRIRR